jgi:hypothetical protein
MNISNRDTAINNASIEQTVVRTASTVMHNPGAVRIESSDVANTPDIRAVTGHCANTPNSMDK